MAPARWCLLLAAMAPCGRALLIPSAVQAGCPASRALRVHTRSPLACARVPAAELRVSIRAAGAKGQGAFAEENRRAGEWVCRYEGELLTLQQTIDMYPHDDPEYLFDLGTGLYLDAQRSEHFSRFFNHHEEGTLRFRIDADGRTVDFFAARDIREGDELTFDYGPCYWLLSRRTPAAGTESRDLQIPLAECLPKGEEGAPPAVTPLKPSQLDALSALTGEERRAALLRALDFFGSRRLGDGQLEIPFGLGPGAPRRVVQVENVDIGVLHTAVAGCIAQTSTVEQPAAHE